MRCPDFWDAWTFEMPELLCMVEYSAQDWACRLRISTPGSFRTRERRLPFGTGTRRTKVRAHIFVVLHIDKGWGSAIGERLLVLTTLLVLQTWAARFRSLVHDCAGTSEVRTSHVVWETGLDVLARQLDPNRVFKTSLNLTALYPVRLWKEKVIQPSVAPFG